MYYNMAIFSSSLIEYQYEIICYFDFILSDEEIDTDKIFQFHVALTHYMSMSGASLYLFRKMKYI